MNSEIDIDPHHVALGQIPWYVNGTLEPGEAQTLVAHLEQCDSCRHDYEAQLRVYEGMQADATLVFAAEPSFRKLMSRIGTAEDAGVFAGGKTASVAAPSAKIPSPARRFGAGGAVRWLAAAAVVEALGLGYGAWAWYGQAPVLASPYVTLSSPAPAYNEGPRVRIVFRAGMSVQNLAVLLHGASAHIIDGPTDSNVYTLGFAANSVTTGVVERRVAALRANADVLFAEPLGASNDSR